jgi:hypothetical protein
MAVYGETVTLRDDKGNIAQTRFFVSASTPALALTAATNVVNLITPLSNAALQNAKGAYTTSPTAQSYGTAAEFDTCEDKAVLTFITATGSIHRYQIPAPKVAIFLADKETVDPANSDIAAFTAAVISNQVCSRDSSLITAYIGGIRRRAKFNRRLNIFTKNPALTGPAE